MTDKISINNHETESPAAPAPANSDTVLIFDQIWKSLGASAESNFTAFKLALDDVLTVLNKMQNDVSNRRNMLSTNKALVDNSVVRIVTPVLPSMGAAAATIGNLITGKIALDIQRLNSAIGVTRGIRTPTDVTEFEKQKIGQVSARLGGLFAEISLATDYVNTIKKVVENKLAGV